MTVKDFVMPLPEDLHTRLEQTVRATKQSFNDVLVHAVRVGNSPNWIDAPAAFQGDSDSYHVRSMFRPNLPKLILECARTLRYYVSRW